MLRKIILAISIISLLLLLAGPGDARAATLYVGSSAAACGGIAPTASTVSGAIAVASNGDTITLCEDIAETVGVININVDVTISGNYGGAINTWTIVDNDQITSALVITGKVNFQNLRMVLRAASPGQDPSRYIVIQSTSVDFYNSDITLSLSHNTYTLNFYDLFEASTSDLSIRNSNVTGMNLYPTYTFYGYLVLFDLKYSNLTINPSNIETGLRGLIISGVYSGTVAPRNYINVFDSTLKNSSYTPVDAFYLELFNNALLSVSVEESFLSASSDVFSIEADTNAQLIVDVINTTVYGGDFVDASLYSASVDIFVDPSTISQEDELFDIYGENADFVAEIRDSNIHVWDELMHLHAHGDSYYEFTLINLEMESHEDGIEIDDAYGYSELYFLFDNVEYEEEDEALFTVAGWGSGLFDDSLLDIDILNSYLDADDEELFWIDTYDYSTLDIYVYNSRLISDEEVVDLDMYDYSRSYFNLEWAWLHSHDHEEVDIDTYDWSRSEFNTSHSFIDTFYLDSEVEAYLIETVYDEISSRDYGAIVYSEWSLLVYALSSKTFQPISGAQVDYLVGGMIFGTDFTDNTGAAMYTFSYFYDSSSPFIPWISVNASFRKLFNFTTYSNYQTFFTMPYWWGNITLLLNIFIVDADLAGHIGFGSLSMTGNQGTLTMGSKGLGGWINSYQVVMNSYMRAQNYLTLNIMVLYKGSWVKGFVFVNLKSGAVYMNFGGIELYGSLR